uniref:Uncharacterized protein n=1 Tax=Medicago truncatula TaxID=3880 RepID=I3S1Z7_MEDTR|nr:unknown [Medicago truncatula]
MPLLSRCRDSLLQPLLFHLLFRDWLLFSRREGLLCINVEHVISNEKCQQQPTNNQENNQAWVEPLRSSIRGNFIGHG